MKKVLPYIFAFIMIAGGIGHIVAPDFYAPLIPDFIPDLLANVLSAIAELGIGVLLLIPKYRHWGGLGFALLMIGFLPLHIWELFREEPVVGPPPAPIIRLVIQLVLIYAGWWLYRVYRPSGLKATA
ncbi:MAG: hypothetical protein AAGN35_01590 [Bacteroidota bacterium]